ncbi:hypothetical protein TL16_g08546 [Triparma laevis f. inornata]|uniref:Uncharacterized protein n=2 Tax=Triparma laevis TaxID=1534972 RepID=A0A9W7CFJ3_9STRA|nr:hypothetical protein TL16_g08546 [Triparma laevis f. inornata]GMI05647.1 hypothetical protein TrLO_g9231 [Triparma laevis f. longispina]
MPLSLEFKLFFLSGLSIIGVLLPYSVPAMKTYLPTIRPFGTGCVISIALLHLLPDALEATENVEMPAWAGDFPLAEGLAVLGFVIMVCIEQIFACPACAVEDALKNQAKDKKDHSHCHHSTSCPPPELTESTTLLPTTTSPPTSSSSSNTPSAEDLYKMYMLEMSIAVHSILVGLPLAASSADSLVWALGLHQLFEGMSLGLAGLGINLDVKGFVKLAALFGASISAGMLAGYCVTGLAEGTWQAYTNSLAAGIVLYVAVEFYEKDFGHHANKHEGKAGKLCTFILGTSVMAIMAIWA